MSACTSVRIKAEDYERVRTIAARYRLTVIEAISLLVDGWGELSEAQQMSALRPPAKARTRKPVLAGK